MSRAAQLLRSARRLAKLALGRDLYAPIQQRIPTERHGGDYGGWTIGAGRLGPASVVYCFGVGTDISFDLGLIQTYGCTVHAFDPTPASIAWARAQNPPPQFQLHPYGLADHDGAVSFYPPDNPEHISHTLVGRRGGAGAISVPVRRLATIAGELGHRTIDLLKMDIEGAEYAVIADLLADGPPVGQLLIEFHHRFPEFQPADTRRAIDQLSQHGFRLFAVSPSGEEYSFIRL